MKIVRPFRSELTDAQGNKIKYFCDLLSTNATDEVIDEHVPTTTYAKDAEVKIESLKRRYISKIDGNNDYPVGSKNWVDMGALNSWAGFDNNMSTQTESTQDLIIEVDTSLATSISIHNMKNITSLTIEHINTDNNDTVTSVIELRDYGAYSMDEFFYDPIRDKEQYIHELEWLPNSKVKLTIPANGNEIAYGMILVGLSQDTGFTLWESSLGQIDHSIYETDPWGNTTFTERAVINTLDAKVLIDTEDIDTTRRLYQEARAQICLFISDERDKCIESTNIVGYVKGSNMPLHPSSVKFDIKIIGVV